MTKTDTREVKLTATIKKYNITNKRDGEGNTEKILKIELEVFGSQVNGVERELIKLYACEPVKINIVPEQQSLLNEDE